MSSPTELTIPLAPPPIILTEAAAQQVRMVIEEEGLVGYGLRIGVTGGGCSGLQYLLDFSETSFDSDFIDEQHDVQIYVDPFSAAHLKGTVINFVDGLNESGFKFENPNIVRACGCGSSFST